MLWLVLILYSVFRVVFRFLPFMVRWCSGWLLGRVFGCLLRSRLCLRFVVRFVIGLLLVMALCLFLFGVAVFWWLGASVASLFLSVPALFLIIVFLECLLRSFSSLCVPPLAACLMILIVFGVMIQIFTSSFKRARRLDSSKFFIVSISRFPPKWFKGYCCFEFAPSAQLLRDYHKGLSDIHYSRRYRQQVLDRVNVHKVFEGLAVLAGGRDVVLCCFEDAFQFCHRRLLAQFVQERFHYSIQEYIRSL